MRAEREAGRPGKNPSPSPPHTRGSPPGSGPLEPPKMPQQPPPPFKESNGGWTDSRQEIQYETLALCSKAHLLPVAVLYILFHMGMANVLNVMSASHRVWAGPREPGGERAGSHRWGSNNENSPVSANKGNREFEATCPRWAIIKSGIMLCV